MAARAATDSPETSGQRPAPTHGLGSPLTPAAHDNPAPRPSPGTTAPTLSGSPVVARARRRLVDALMDAGRIRSIRAADPAWEVGRGSDRPDAGRRDPVDFIGLALTVVVGRPVRTPPLSPPLSPSSPGATQEVWPATPALDALSALFCALEDHGAPPDGASLRHGGPAVQRELSQLCRLACLSSAGAEAVAGTAGEIAALLADFAGRLPVTGAAAPPASRARSDARPGIVDVGVEARLAGTTVGPGGDNAAEAVVLARLFLRRLFLGRLSRSSDRRPCAAATGPGSSATADAPPPAGLQARSRGLPIYPAADDSLFRSIGHWRSQDLPAPRRAAADRALGRPSVQWGRAAAVLATLTVGAPDWTEMRRRAGCADLRLRVVAGTAVVLVDRRLGAVRAAAQVANRALPVGARAAAMAAAVAFHGATGQTLVCRRLDGPVLLMTVEVDWIDPWGARRCDPDGLDAVADVAPLAAIRLIDAARAALAEHPGCWTLTGALGPGGVRRLAVRLADALPVPAGG